MKSQDITVKIEIEKVDTLALPFIHEVIQEALASRGLLVSREEIQVFAKIGA